MHLSSFPAVSCVLSCYRPPSLLFKATPCCAAPIQGLALEVCMLPLVRLPSSIAEGVCATPAFPHQTLPSLLVPVAVCLPTSLPNPTRLPFLVLILRLSLMELSA